MTEQHLAQELANTPDEPDRPDACETEHLEYLDRLRESGVTQMFGAGPYLAEGFDLSMADANEILIYWMKTFGNENR